MIFLLLRHLLRRGLLRRLGPATRILSVVQLLSPRPLRLGLLIHLLLLLRDLGMFYIH